MAVFNAAPVLRSPFRPSRGLLAFARLALALALATGAAALSGCTPAIGDHCQLSTDCGIRGDRICDTTQPDGYCTQVNCSRGGCPAHASCVLFSASIPGCGYNDRVVSRTGRSSCMATCEKDGDCRQGYVCRDPQKAPWSAFVLDEVLANVCIVAPPMSSLPVPDASGGANVCGPGGTVDGGYTVTGGDAGVATDASAADAAADAGTDAGPADAASTAPDAAADSGLDGG